MKVIVVGIGNDLRGDDAIGPEFVRRIKGVDKLVSNFPDLSIAEKIKDYDIVFFVDASIDVDKFELVQINIPKLSTFSHNLSIENIFHISKLMYNKSLRGYILKIGGYNFGYTHGLSKCAEENVELATRFFYDFLKSNLNR
ncbi:MAG: hydrogenase maturation protease [Candidatus Calescibacterium sp.]|nr:hydrogenase maturation protease [Candidatus Calescibacterium sp.]MDW8132927.1 hydrogenase maturation protease [Candidatus Calescibacterium sp.]